MNKVILIGRLTRDAELKQLGGEGKSVLNFTIAVNRDYLNNKNEREADFVPVVYWNKSGEILQTYLTKGRFICVTGRISIKSYESKEGIRKYITQIIADEIQFLDSNKSKEIV